MNNVKLKEEQLKLEKKLINEPTLKSRIEELRLKADKNDKSALEFQLKELANHAQVIESQKKSDEELQRITEIKKELLAPYSEKLKFIKLQSRLIGLLLQELRSFNEDQP